MWTWTSSYRPTDTLSFLIYCLCTRGLDDESEESRLRSQKSRPITSERPPFVAWLEAVVICLIQFSNHFGLYCNILTEADLSLLDNRIQGRSLEVAKTGLALGLELACPMGSER